jgi:cytochrome c biogenesis protein CcmG/thiol:disulfide interchange protein DsbE
MSEPATTVTEPLDPTNETPSGTYKAGATPPKRKPWVAITIVAVVVLLAVALLGASLKVGGAGGLDPNNPNGARAPGFTLPKLDGSGNLSLASLHGKPIVLNFWASWCGPCQEEGPVLAAGYDRWAKKGVTFLGVDSMDSIDWGRAFEQRMGIHYQSVVDANGLTKTNYGVTGWPETFFIEPNGKILSKWIGPLDPQTLDTSIQTLLAAG